MLHGVLKEEQESLEMQRIAMQRAFVNANNGKNESLFKEDNEPVIKTKEEIEAEKKYFDENW